VRLRQGRRFDACNVKVRAILNTIRRAAVRFGKDDDQAVLAHRRHFRVADLEDLAAAHPDPHGLKRLPNQHGSECFRVHTGILSGAGGFEQFHRHDVAQGNDVMIFGQVAMKSVGSE
jgi:hypothetical protein